MKFECFDILHQGEDALIEFAREGETAVVFSLLAKAEWPMKFTVGQIYELKEVSNG